MLHDAIVIGSGDDGISAASEAASAGLDVLLVDALESGATPRTTPGSVLLGLLHETVLEIRAAHRVLGRLRSPSELRGHFARVLARRRDEAVRFHRAFLRERLAAAGVRVCSGQPRLLAAGEVEIAPGDVRRAPIVVLAVGARARRPSRFPFDDRIVCDADSVLLADGVPRSVLVIGADVIGCEFACMFAALGSQVTLVERRRRLLRFVDADLREILHRSMQRMGVAVVLEEEVRAVSPVGSGSDGHALVVLGSGRSEVAERVLVAAGGVPRTELLGLDRAGVASDERGFVVVDERWRTSQAGVWATGGAVDALTPIAALGHQGRSAMLDAIGAGVDPAGDAPLAIHTIPELATVGLSKEACEHLDLRSIAASAPLGRVLRARIRGEEEGILKLVVDAESLRVLGVHVVGMGAHEIVHLGAAAMRRVGGAEELARTVFSSGSLSSAYQAAALEALRTCGAKRPGRNSRPTDDSAGRW